MLYIENAKFLRCQECTWYKLQFIMQYAIGITCRNLSAIIIIFAVLRVYASTESLFAILYCKSTMPVFVNINRDTVTMGYIRCKTR